ncbi:hypothetical protein MTR_4g065800 [Medicago truncatula]|uniref:Uncharacterized protein n=1 Tax=Medicago truncatula TaxID=3880 RepID=A0A072UKG2_MEDTR|nr:hypothetical protein MTR_4g065800 [Medicago truncatula]
MVIRSIEIALVKLIPDLATWFTADKEKRVQYLSGKQPHTFVRYITTSLCSQGRSLEAVEGCVLMRTRIGPLRTLWRVSSPLMRFKDPSEGS